MYKYNNEFRKENPQTIGESDSHFDLSNYKDWLEEKVAELDFLNFTIKENNNLLNKTILKTNELTEYVDLIEFMEKINYMRKLYKNQRYTQAERERDKLIVELDDVMRL